MTNVAHILIGSFSSGSSDFLAPLLVDQGYSVDLIHDQYALSQIAPKHIDLLLLDVTAADDLAMLAHLRTFIDRAIIAITPHCNDQLLVAALNKGADDVIQSPFRTDELFARIRALLRRQGWNATSTGN